LNANDGDYSRKPSHASCVVEHFEAGGPVHRSRQALIDPNTQAVLGSRNLVDFLCDGLLDSRALNLVTPLNIRPQVDADRYPVPPNLAGRDAHAIQMTIPLLLALLAESGSAISA